MSQRQNGQDGSGREPRGRPPIVKVNADYACDLALIEIRQGGQRRFYEFQDLFGTIDLSTLGEPSEVLDLIEQQLATQAPRCQVIR